MGWLLSRDVMVYCRKFLVILVRRPNYRCGLLSWGKIYSPSPSQGFNNCICILFSLSFFSPTHNIISCTLFLSPTLFLNYSLLTSCSITLNLQIIPIEADIMRKPNNLFSFYANNNTLSKNLFINVIGKLPNVDYVLARALY